MRPRFVFPYPGGRRPQNEDRVTLKPTLNMKLRDFVKGSSREKAVPCMFELTLLFSCFKEHDFEESMCVNEVQSFHKCVVHHIEVEEKLRERQKNPEKYMSSSTKYLSPQEINNVLKKYRHN